MELTLNEYLSGLKGQRVAVVGIGVSNTPLIRLLVRAGVKVTACDKRTREQFNGQADALELTPMDDAFDTLMLGTRTLDGVELDAFAARHGRALLEALRPELDRLISQGLAEPDAARFRLTERGLMLQNTVLVDIMEAIERIS